MSSVPFLLGTRKGNRLDILEDKSHKEGWKVHGHREVAAREQFGLPTGQMVEYNE